MMICKLIDLWQGDVVVAEKIKHAKVGEIMNLDEVCITSHFHQCHRHTTQAAHDRSVFIVLMAHILTCYL